MPQGNDIVQMRLAQPALGAEKGVVSSAGISQTFSGTKEPVSFGVFFAWDRPLLHRSYAFTLIW